jgi:hypothetical protein
MASSSISERPSLAPSRPDPEASVDPMEVDQQDDQGIDQLATPPADLPEDTPANIYDLASNAPPVEARGNIKEIWPDGCDNELPELAAHLERFIESILLPETIYMYIVLAYPKRRKLTGDRSFNEIAERLRDNSNMLPPEFYRTHYETSTTLSANVDKHTHPKHRSNIKLKIGGDNAFQSIGSFRLSIDLTRERIERHLVWNKKKDPSSLISVFDSQGMHQVRLLFCSS